MVNKFKPSDLLTLTLIREVGGPIFPTGIAKAISPQPKILLTSNGVKLGQMGSNGTKRDQIGPNGAKRSQRG